MATKRPTTRKKRHGARRAGSGWGRPVSSRHLKQKAEEKPKSRRYRSYLLDVVPLYKNRPGPNYVRVVPPRELAELNYYAYECYVHQRVGVNNGNYICYAEMRGEACARCERQSGLWDTNPDLAKGLYPSLRYLMWVQDRLDEEDPDRILLFDCPKTVANGILKRSERKHKGKKTGEYIDVSHPTDGRFVSWDYTPPSSGTPGQYDNIDVEYDDPVNELDEEIWDTLPLFEDILNHHDYDELRSVDAGGDEEEEEEDSEYDEDDGLEGLTRRELKLLNRDEGLGIRVFRSMSDADLVEAIREARAGGPVEEEPEEEEQEVFEQNGEDNGEPLRAIDVDDRRADLRAKIDTMRKSKKKGVVKKAGRGTARGARRK